MTPEPAKYEIRTLRDIFSLPTPEAMERCLKELGEMMTASRAYAELLTATAEHLALKDGKTLPHTVWKWPESMTWTDDGSVMGSELKLMDPRDETKVLSSLCYKRDQPSP